jgi:hypothetical protein
VDILVILDKDARRGKKEDVEAAQHLPALAGIMKLILI